MFLFIYLFYFIYLFIFFLCKSKRAKNGITSVVKFHLLSHEIECTQGSYLEPRQCSPLENEVN